MSARKIVFLLAVFVIAACAKKPVAPATPTVVPTPFPGALSVDPDISLGEISPLVYGSNHGPWIALSVEGLQPAYDSGLTILRFPAGSWGDHNDVQTYQIDQFMSFIEKAGATAMINVRLPGSTPEQAAEMVRYVNVEMKYDVTYWGIGNEPTLYNDELKNRGDSYDVDRFNQEWRAFAEAMKKMDSHIQLIGPEAHQFSFDVTNTTNYGISTAQDRNGKYWMDEFLKANGDLVDIVSIHRYPFPVSSVAGPPSVEELQANAREWDKIIIRLRELIHANTGRDLPIAVTEFNSAYNKSVGVEDFTGFALQRDLAWGCIGRMIRNGVGACIKHFVANDQEFERTTMSSEVDERTLREIYLEPFRIAIRNSNPWSIMSGYNRVNGVYACQNDHTLQDILRKEWGYEGIVISDWFGTYDDGAPSGGLDIEMPGPARWMASYMVMKALENGTLTEEGVDDKVRRLLRVVEKVGLFENPTHPPEHANDRPEHRKIIREAAGEAIVLLKNEDILPLKKVRSIAVIGPYAATAQIFGGGSSSGFLPHYRVSPFEEIKNRAGGKIKVNTAPGCFIYKNLPPPAPETLSTADGRPGLNLSLFNGTQFAGAAAHTRVTTLVQHDWFDHSVPDVDQESFSMRMEGFFTPQETGTHTLSVHAIGWARLYLDDKLIIDHSSDSDSGKQLTTKLKLKGRQSHAIKLEYYWKGPSIFRAIHIGHQPPHADDLIGEAVRLAKKSDVVILIAGLNKEWETEGADRVDMKLPGQQNELIERVVQANPNTIVVLNVGSAVEMPWINKVPAILQLWYAGQEQGNALADILFGDVNPSGKLPTTFPARLEDNPAYTNYPGENGKVRYGEGIFVGYRYYDKKDVAPLFPFGHGLSYTNFKYGNARLSSKKISANEKLTVKVDVTNTGKVPGKEIVQLYVHDMKSTFARPKKELKAFEKIELKPKQTKTVTFTLDREAFWHFDDAKNGWNTEAGEFEILVGASSRDNRSRESFTLI